MKIDERDSLNQIISNTKKNLKKALLEKKEEENRYDRESRGKNISMKAQKT